MSAIGVIKVDSMSLDYSSRGSFWGSSVDSCKALLVMLPKKELIGGSG